jgi:hypothetical protein
MLLTASAVVMGVVAASFLSRMAVPVVYYRYLIPRRGRAEALRQECLAPTIVARVKESS